MRRQMTVLVLIALLAGCSSDDGADGGDSAGEETTEEPNAQQVAVAGSIATLQQSRAEADRQWENVVGLDMPLLEPTIELFEADQQSAETAVAELPDQLDGVDPDAYGRFVAATEMVAADAGEVVGRLSSDAVAAEPDQVGAVTGAIGDHLDVVDDWREACFELSPMLEVDQPIDCVGLPLEPEGEPAADVEVSIECQQGDDRTELPFDRSPFPFLTNPDFLDQDWVYSQVTIDNRSDQPVQVDPSFRVRFLDDDGELIAELPWFEPTEVALWAPPQSQLHRKGLNGPLLGLPVRVRADDPTPQQAEEILARTGSCEVVEPVAAVHTEPDAYIDDVPVELGELNCERRDDEGRYYYDVDVTNPTDETVTVALTVGFVDADGNKLGQTGLPVEVPPGETVTAQSSSVNYTIHSIDDVVDCQFFLVREM
jgi:hypothetical protein